MTSEEDNYALYFDMDDEHFAWRDPRPQEIEMRRAHMSDVLIFDILLYALATDSLLLVSGLPVAADAPGPSETLDLVNFASLLSSYCLPLVSLSLSAVSPLSLTSLCLGSYLSATTCATSRSFRHMLAFKFPSRLLATALRRYH